jgi:hypothetical protein
MGEKEGAGVRDLFVCFGGLGNRLWKTDFTLDSGEQESGGATPANRRPGYGFRCFAGVDWGVAKKPTTFD